MSEGVVDPRQPWVVIAELEVRPECRQDFLALASRFAARCRADEPGCLQFQIVTLDGPPPTVLFHEVYADAQAFAAHREAPHLAEFQRAFQAMVLGERALRQGRRVDGRP